MPFELRKVYVDADPIPNHPWSTKGCEYLKAGMCFWCCDACNYDNHKCLFCGADLDHNLRDSNGEPHGCYDAEEQDEYFALLQRKGAISG